MAPGHGSFAAVPPAGALCRRRSLQKTGTSILLLLPEGSASPGAVKRSEQRMKLWLWNLLGVTWTLTAILYIGLSVLGFFEDSPVYWVLLSGIITILARQEGPEK